MSEINQSVKNKSSVPGGANALAELQEREVALFVSIQTAYLSNNLSELDDLNEELTGVRAAIYRILSQN